MPELTALPELTGVLAVTLVFLSGPYRTIQKRWPRMWGPVLSVWAHGNVSLAATVAVFIHLLVVGELELEIFPVEPSLDPPLLTYIATILFATSLGSGFFGLYVATAPQARQRWLNFHRNLTSVFYLSLLPHILTEGVIQWPVFLLLVASWAIFAARPQLPDVLARANWPLGAKRRVGTRLSPTAEAPVRRLAAFVIVTGLVLLAGAWAVSFFWITPGGERELEVYGSIREVSDGSFILTTRDGPEHVLLSAQPEFEGGQSLTELQQQRVIIEVEGVRQPDGSIVASKVEVEGQGYSD